METASPVATNETLRNCQDILPLASKLLKETKTMDPYKKYIMGQPKYRSRGSTRDYGRDEKKRSPRTRKSGLQELDETVASVEQSQRSISRRSRADESSSVGSYTIATREGNSIYEHKNLIDNLQMMNIGSNSELKQNKSIYSKRSRRSRTSRRSNRKNLERVVTDTILDSASWGGAHFITTREEELSSKKISAESILEDLDQASAIIESEMRSTRSMRSSRSTYSRKEKCSPSTTHRDPSPMMCCVAEDSMFANFDTVGEEMKASILNTSTDVAMLGKSSQRLVSAATPDTSASSSYDAEPAKRIPTTQILQDNSWPDVFEGLEHGGKSFSARTTTTSSSHSNNKFDPYNMDAFITQEWTNFDANPFFTHSSSDQEHNSTDSPNSIVYLDSNKKKNRSKTASRQRDDTASTKISI